MPSENDRIYERWKKLVARAADTSSKPNERATARKAAEKTVEDHPWIRERYERETRQGSPRQTASRASAEAAAAWLRRVVDDVVTAAQEEAASHAPDIARDLTRRAFTAFKDKLNMPSPDRLTTQAILDEIIVSGRTLPSEDEDDDGHDDQIVVVLVLSADLTDTLCKRYEAGEGQNSIVSRLGKTVMSAIGETYVNGEAGDDWPFDEDEEDVEEE